MAINCKDCKAYCCRKIGMVNKDLDRGDGVCKHLDENNKCEIYNNRPLICNTDRLYEVLYSKFMSKEEWVLLNIKGCEKLHEDFKETNQEEESSESRLKDQIPQIQTVEGLKDEETSRTEA